MTNATSKRIGFIGLGNQAAPLAMQLVKAGLDVTVWDQRAEAMEPFIDAGAKAAQDAAELGQRCDFVEICVVDDAGARATVEGPSGLLQSMARGSMIAAHSTVSPETCQSLAKVAAEHGVTLIDTPVSGGAKLAEAGQKIGRAHV